MDNKLSIRQYKLGTDELSKVALPQLVNQVFDSACEHVAVVFVVFELRANLDRLID
jgi:hypothetical protein